MSRGPKPSASEVLDLLDRLERDPATRILLSSSIEIFNRAVEEGRVHAGSIDWFAQRMQELVGEELIAHGPVGLGQTAPPVWDGYWIQQISEWRVTARGRADASLYRREQRALSTTPHSQAPNRGVGERLDQRDLFISHAGEDKDQVAAPLARLLQEQGWTVWLDQLELTVGDSLERRINAALAQSSFGVVILSPAFLAKPWPRRELAGLAAREVASGGKVILPVWHGVDHAYLAEHEPILADKLAADTRDGLPVVAERISEALLAARLAAPDSGKRVVQSVTSYPDGSHTVVSSVDRELHPGDPNWVDPPEYKEPR